MRFKVGCELQYNVETDSTFLFHVGVIDTESQRRVEETLQFKPGMEFQDRQLPGSERRYLHLNTGPGPLTLRYVATVDLNPTWGAVEDAVQMPTSELPLEVLPYLLPSRYCPSDCMITFAYKEFGEYSHGFTRVTAVCNWIHEQLEYTPGSSDSSTTATDTLIQRMGVCRDYAHLGVAFCRALNIPARFLSMYAWGLPQPDFHACFECYLGGRWILFDATRLAPLTGFVRIGEGRDAADISFSSVYGVAELTGIRTYADVVPQPSDDQTEPLWTTAPLISR